MILYPYEIFATFFLVIDPYSIANNDELVKVNIL